MVATSRAAVVVMLTTSMMLLLGAGGALGQAPAPGEVRGDAGAHSLTIVVRGLRSDRGSVLGALFDRPTHWVREGQESAACRAEIRGRIARCRMQVPSGRYAFAFAHDEDGNGVLDRDVLGIPHEGYGFSNDVRPSLSLPSWQSAAFVVSEVRGGALYVTARYGL